MAMRIEDLRNGDNGNTTSILKKNAQDTLNQAVKIGNLDWARQAIEEGADIHYNDERPLRWAVEHNNMVLCQDLVQVKMRNFSPF